MKTIEKKDNQITFIAEIDESLANAIRRYANEIPVLAIDEIEIFKNDSSLYDETIAHRLGLIPLKNISVSEKTPLKLKLSSKEGGVVYSKGLKGNIDVVYDKIPITFLSKGQELELLAIAKFGKGSEHAKFSPGLIFYRDVSEIIMDKSLKEKIKKVCPENEIKERGGKILILNNKKKEILDVCEGIAEKNKKDIEVKPTGELIITIESFGQMFPESILKKSIEKLKKDISEISKKISK